MATTWASAWSPPTLPPGTSCLRRCTRRYAQAMVLLRGETAGEHAHHDRACRIFHQQPAHRHQRRRRPGQRVWPAPDKAALEERLGDCGVVYGNAGNYRTAVRTTLFPGLTEQRYDALITALLQLRAPKLSQRLDPALLSTLLSRVLPPLGHRRSPTWPRASSVSTGNGNGC